MMPQSELPSAASQHARPRVDRPAPEVPQAGVALERALLRHAAALFLLLDDDNVIRYASPAAGRILGRSSASLHDLPVASLVHPDDRAALATILAEIDGAREEMSPVEARVWHGRGGWQRVTLTGVDLRDEPGVGSRVLRIRDLSALREFERRNAAFLALGQQLGAATTAEAAARIIAAVSDDLLHWDAYFLSLYAREDDLLLPVLSIDLIRGRRTEVPETAPDGEVPGPLSRRILTTGPELILRHGAPTDPTGLDPFGDEERLSASLIYVPIRADEATVGIQPGPELCRGCLQRGRCRPPPGAGRSLRRRAGAGARRDGAAGQRRAVAPPGNP
jgi:PAS domain S-box-containing protein